MLWKRQDYRLELGNSKRSMTIQTTALHFFFFSLEVIIILHLIRNSPLPEDGCDSSSNPCDPGERQNGHETIIRLEELRLK